MELRRNHIRFIFHQPSNTYHAYKSHANLCTHPAWPSDPLTCLSCQARLTCMCHQVTPIYLGHRAHSKSSSLLDPFVLSGQFDPSGVSSQPSLSWLSDLPGPFGVESSVRLSEKNFKFYLF